MRTRCALLLALLAAVACAAIVATASAASVVVPGSGYVWAQPGTAAVSSPYSQPPAWIPPSTPSTTYAVTGYVWAQPGTAVVSVPSAQPPPSIPIAPKREKEVKQVIVRSFE